MKILITGATGFIGSHLVERLVKDGHEVRVLVRKSEFENPNEHRKDCVELLKSLERDIEIVFGDLLDEESLENAVKDVNVVFHLAAIARPMAIPDKLYFDINEKGTENLLEACLSYKKNLKKIVIMSSISAVGPARDGKGVSEKTECKPVDVYGWSKLAQEKVAMKYFNDYEMPIVFLRPPMVFGPRDFEMLRLFKAVDKRFFPLSCNKEVMEFLYVKNLVDACLLVLDKGEDGEKYHISNEKHYSINEIVKSIEKCLGKRVVKVKFPKFVFILGGYFIEGFSWFFNKHPPFKHDTVKWMTEKFWYSDISKARRELGYFGRIELDEGVRRGIEWYKSKGLM